VIVVVGQPLYRSTDEGTSVDGLAARIAVAAAALGRSVQLVGKAGEDPEGDAVILALARGSVGHVAVLRDAGMATPIAAPPVEDDPDESSAPVETVSSTTRFDAADIELALRYLIDFSVVVLAVPADPDIARVVAAAAGWGDASLIVVLPVAAPIPDGLPADAIVFEAPDTDPDGVFATMVGSFAAALDDGGDRAAAFHATIEEAGWTPTPAD
jgi:sugar/nucleoside kinase (ribokinase family)